MEFQNEHNTIIISNVVIFENWFKVILKKLVPDKVSPGHTEFLVPDKLVPDTWFAKKVELLTFPTPKKPTFLNFKKKTCFCC